MRSARSATPLEDAMLERFAPEEHFHVDVLLGDTTWETSYGIPGEGDPPRTRARPHARLADVGRRRPTRSLVRRRRSRRAAADRDRDRVPGPALGRRTPTPPPCSPSCRRRAPRSAATASCAPIPRSRPATATGCASSDMRSRVAFEGGLRPRRGRADRRRTPRPALRRPRRLGLVDPGPTRRSRAHDLHMTGSTQHRARTHGRREGAGGISRPVVTV